MPKRQPRPKRDVLAKARQNPPIPSGLPDLLPDEPTAENTIAGWAEATAAHVNRISSRRRQLPKTLDDIVAAHESEEADKLCLKAFCDARDLLQAAAAWVAPPVNAIVSSRSSTPAEFSPILSAELRVPRSFATPIQDKVMSYFVHALAFDMPEDTRESLEAQKGAHTRLQTATALWRGLASDAHREAVRIAAADVARHPSLGAFDDLPEGFDEEHPLTTADYLAAALRPEYQGRLEAKRHLRDAIDSANAALALLKPKQALALSAALSVMRNESNRIYEMWRLADYWAREQGESVPPVGKARTGRPVHPMNRALRDVLVALMRAAPPGSPAEIAEIITTRYQHPITADQVSTHLGNMKKTARLPVPRVAQKPGRRKAVKELR